MNENERKMQGKENRIKFKERKEKFFKERGIRIEEVKKQNGEGGIK